MNRIQAGKLLHLKNSDSRENCHRRVLCDTQPAVSSYLISSLNNFQSEGI
jgi:hypothetical protein